MVLTSSILAGAKALVGRFRVDADQHSPGAGRDYQVVMTNVAGGVTSEVAVLTVVLPGPVTFTLNSHTNQPGETVMAQATLSGFAQATSAHLTLQWDPAALAFAGIGACGLNGIAAGSFGTTLTSSGKLTFSWDYPNAAGVTVAGATVIFTVSLVVVGSGASVSPLALVDVPTMREVAVNFEVAIFGSVDGQVQVISLASPPVLVFRAPKLLTNGAVELTFDCAPSCTYWIQASTNLASWRAIYSTTPSSNKGVLTDTHAIGLQSYYYPGIGFSATTTVPHPADLNVDFQIDGAELTAYSNAVVAHAFWLIWPRPITLDLSYYNKAVHLRLHNSDYYHCDSSLPPLGCWVTGP